MSMVQNSDNGYIKLYRKIWDHAVFANIQEVAIFAWMISVAAWRPCTLRTRWGKVHLGTGQVLVSERYIANGLNMQQRTVRKVFARMVADGMIQKVETQADQKAGTTWEILNYHKYQTSNEPIHQTEDHSVIATAIATAIDASSANHRSVIKVQVLKEVKKGRKERREESLSCGPDLPFDPPILADERQGERDTLAVWGNSRDSNPTSAIAQVSVPMAPPDSPPDPAMVAPPKPDKRIRQGTTRIKRPTEMDEAMEGEFETWFAAYGRLERKAEARAAYLKVRQQGVDPMDLLNAARTQALHRAVQMRRQACVWLRARQWEDVIAADQPLPGRARDDGLGWLRDREAAEEAARHDTETGGPIIDGRVEPELETVH